MSVGAATPEPRTSSSGQSTGAPGAVGPPLAGWLRGLGRAATRPVPYLSVRKMRPTTRGPGGPGLLPLPFPDVSLLGPYVPWSPRQCSGPPQEVVLRMRLLKTIPACNTRSVDISCSLQNQSFKCPVLCITWKRGSVLRTSGCEGDALYRWRA